MQKVSKNLGSKLNEYIDLYCTGDEDIPSTDIPTDFENYLMMGYDELKWLLPDPWTLIKRSDVPLMNLKDLE